MTWPTHQHHAPCVRIPALLDTHCPDDISLGRKFKFISMIFYYLLFVVVSFVFLESRGREIAVTRKIDGTTKNNREN